MKKPNLLRAALTAAMPELAARPEALQIYVDKGKVAVRAGAGVGFEYRYRLNLILEDFAGDHVAVFATILNFLARYEPDVLQAAATNDAAIQFEADILDATKVDLSLELNLSEAIVGQARQDGGVDLVFRDEPDWTGAVAAAVGAPPLQQLYLGGQLLVGEP